VTSSTDLFVHLQAVSQTNTFSEHQPTCCHAKCERASFCQL